MMTAPDHWSSLLKTHFGFTDFRPDQLKIITALHSGHDVLGLLPTGGGKSLCYQFPSLLFTGVTVVISPLIALMKDQVDTLLAKGIAATAITSTDTFAVISHKLSQLAQRKYRLVYVAPERLGQPGFVSACKTAGIALLAVDEAHCVSQWGHDFRPDYLRIKDFAAKMGHVPILALTATATVNVQEDIKQRLGMEKPVLVEQSPDRPNLKFAVQKHDHEEELKDALFAAVRQLPGLGIVYVQSRKEAEGLAKFLSKLPGKKVLAYHAGLPSEVRIAVQEAFMQGVCDLVVATNAFGMGIDKANIRAVFHVGLPASLEAYYQEVGRAGRDGQLAEVTIFMHATRSVALREWLLEQEKPSRVTTDTWFERYLRQPPKLRQSLQDTDMGLLSILFDLAQSARVTMKRQNYSWDLEVQTPFTEADRELLWQMHWKQYKARLSLWEAMRAYTEANSCRRDFLLTYFGKQHSRSNTICCDNCHTKQSALTYQR